MTSSNLVMSPEVRALAGARQDAEVAGRHGAELRRLPLVPRERLENGR